jgi:hypothetical protein
VQATINIAPKEYVYAPIETVTSSLNIREIPSMLENSESNKMAISFIFTCFFIVSLMRMNRMKSYPTYHEKYGKKIG